MMILFFESAIFCQADSEDKKKSFLKINLNYLSNSVYSGRKDSAVVPYLRSSITYNDKSGLYIGAGASMLVSKDESNRIDLFNIDGGYSFNIKKLDAGIYASKYFYSDASFAVGSELKGLVGMYLGYDLGVATLNGGANVLFSTNTDLSTSLGLSHSFEFGEKDKLITFNPTFQLNAGTQYFNKAYYEFRKFPFATTANNSGGGNSGKRKGRSGGSNSGSGSGSSIVKNVTFYDKNKFTILDYELLLPVNYDRKRWGLFANPVVAFPVNAASIAIDNKLTKENLSTSFFIELGGYIKF